MAMTECPECDSDVSDQADECPECGLPHPGSNYKRAKENAGGCAGCLLPVALLAGGLAVLLAMAASATPAFAQSEAGVSESSEASCEHGRPVELESCYDGDTCEFEGLPADVRFARIDTPEMDGACSAAAQKAAQALRRYLRRADQICVKVKERGYYDRLISEVWADGTNVNDWLLEFTSAVEYGESTCSKSKDESDDDSDEGAAASGEVQCTEDVNCSDLDSCKRAEAFLEGCEGDPHNLDGNGDGQPCASLCN